MISTLQWGQEIFEIHDTITTLRAFVTSSQELKRYCFRKMLKETFLVFKTVYVPDFIGEIKYGEAKVEIEF